MNYRSQQNLEAGFDAFVADHDEVTLFTAYIKLAALERINTSRRINQIVTRDVCGPSPASDLEEIWNYCQTHNIKLYRNTQLHMKVLWNNSHKAIVGSANITRNGLGLRDRANWEFASRVRLGQEDLLYLNTVLFGTDTTLVTEELYQALGEAERYAQVHVPEVPEVHPPNTTEGQFLTNQLPMFKDVAGMYTALQNLSQLNETNRNCDLEAFTFPMRVARISIYYKKSDIKLGIITDGAFGFIRMREIDPLTRDLDAFTFPMRVARLDDLSPEAVIDLLLPEEKT